MLCCEAKFMNLSLPAYGAQRSTACVWALSALSAATRGVVLSLASAHAVIAARFSSGPNLARLSVPFHHNRNWKIKILQPYDVSVLSCSLEALVGWLVWQGAVQSWFDKVILQFLIMVCSEWDWNSLCARSQAACIYLFIFNAPGGETRVRSRIWLAVYRTISCDASPARLGQKQIAETLWEEYLFLILKSQ